MKLPPRLQQIDYPPIEFEDFDEEEIEYDLEAVAEAFEEDGPEPFACQICRDFGCYNCR